MSNKNLIKSASDNTLASALELVLHEAERLGGQQAEASISTGEGLSVTVRMGNVDKVEHEADKGLGLTIYVDGKKGSANTSDFSTAALKNSVAAAYHIACHTGVDECAGLAPAELMAHETPDLDLYHPWDLDPKAAISLASECEAYARAVDAKIVNADGTNVSRYSGTYLYANSHGFCAGWDASYHLIDCAMVAEDSNGMQQDGWYSKARDPDDLWSVEQIGVEAARRAVAKLSPKTLPTKTVPVIFSAPVAASLFSALITAISGESLYRRASFLLDKLGAQIFAPQVHIREAPYLKKALGSAPFDADGVATREKDIIKDGILHSYLLSNYSARRLDLETTANAGGVHNLLVEPGDLDLSAMLEEMDSGFLITDMIGFGVNQVTGDYSRGASGFWIEGGEIAYPVEGVTVAGDLLQMYQGILAIGNDVDARGNILTGSVLIDQMTVAGY